MDIALLVIEYENFNFSWGCFERAKLARPGLNRAEFARSYAELRLRQAKDSSEFWAEFDPRVFLNYHACLAWKSE